MKSQVPDHEIETLLRTNKPGLPDSPALESRILRALHEHRRPTPRKWWPWFLLPPAVAAAAMVLLHVPSSPSPGMVQQQTPGPEVNPESTESLLNMDPALSLLDAGNPLKSESVALGRDAERAGNFLIDCLPSVAAGGE